MNCQRLFSGQKKKNIAKCRLLKFLPVFRVNGINYVLHIFLYTTSEIIKKKHTLKKPTDLDLHCLLRQDMSCSAREGLRKVW